MVQRRPVHLLWEHFEEVSVYTEEVKAKTKNRFFFVTSVANEKKKLGALSETDFALSKAKNKNEQQKDSYN